MAILELNNFVSPDHAPCIQRSGRCVFMAGLDLDVDDLEPQLTLSAWFALLEWVLVSGRWCLNVSRTQRFSGPYCFLKTESSGVVLLCPILSKLLTCYGIVKEASRIWHLVMKTLGMRHVSFGSELLPRLTFFWRNYVKVFSNPRSQANFITCYNYESRLWL